MYTLERGAMQWPPSRRIPLMSDAALHDLGEAGRQAASSYFTY